MERLEEQLAIVTGEWADDTLDFHGRHYETESLNALPKPVQRPRPNLLLGGSGGPRSLALAARFADEYNTVFKTADECAQVRQDLDAACEKAGRDPIPLSLMSGWLVGDDRNDLLDRTKRLAELRGDDSDPEDFLASLPDQWIAGTIDEARQQLQQLENAGVERVMAQNLLHRDLDVVELLSRF
jgi:alkanesulfonate monooxygenase SsuD/methylene tetrahydromethanopterin reductase-like flavin-dependent oxidoreductase (luciferase family)